METLLSGISGVGVFLDDVVVSGKNPQEHRASLEEVLRRFSNANLRLQRKKCRFGVQSVIYLGHHIGPDGVKPTAEKVSAVEDAPAPKGIKELQAWLGLINYYSKIPKGSGHGSRAAVQAAEKRSEVGVGPRTAEGVSGGKGFAEISQDPGTFR